MSYEPLQRDIDIVFLLAADGVTADLSILEVVKKCELKYSAPLQLYRRGSVGEQLRKRGTKRWTYFVTMDCHFVHRLSPVCQLSC